MNSKKMAGILSGTLVSALVAGSMAFAQDNTASGGGAAAGGTPPTGGEGGAAAAGKQGCKGGCKGQGKHKGKKHHGKKKTEDGATGSSAAPGGGT